MIPLEVTRWVVILAPRAEDGGPDGGRIRGFLVPPGINYRADTWHHPVATLDGRARFAAFMWVDGGSEDEEFRELPEAVLLEEAPAEVRSCGR